MTIVPTDSSTPRRRPATQAGVSDASRDRARLSMLAEIGLLLASSDDHRTALHRVIEITVPALADWCSLHVVDASTGQLERIAIRHADPVRIEMATLLAPGAELDAIVGCASRVFSSGQSERGLLGTASYIAAPLVVRRRPIGVLTLVHAESRKDHDAAIGSLGSSDRFDGDDVQFIEELARRIAMYVDHAMLVREVTATRADNARLVLAAQELVAALGKNNTDLEQLAYIASHDLRAPLRGIANLSQWIEEDMGERMSATSREHFTLLLGRVRRLENLIQGVLDYTRAGRVADEAQEIDVGKLVTEVIELQAPPKTVQFEIDANLPTVRSTRVPLQRVFTNLVANALKYGTHAEPRIEIGAEPIAEGWEFYVRDNGPGIPRRFQGQIWSLFQTLHSRDKIESTGVGLSIVRRIVEAHGGRAWVDSEEGGGATFRFTWPKDPPRSRSWDRVVGAR